MKKNTLLFSVMILLYFQSCVVYQTTPIPLSEATDQGKVKVIKNSGEELKFIQIIKKDSAYYGFNKEKLKNDSGLYEWVDITSELNADELEAIYLKDQKKSSRATTYLTVLVSIPIVIGSFFIFAFAISG